MVFFAHLLNCKLKHKVFRKPFGITLHSLIQHAGFDFHISRQGLDQTSPSALLFHKFSIGLIVFLS